MKFFAAVASYLAKETGSLAFLDVATCGEDENGEMPSWVPNWTRRVSKPAYDFASRVKKNRILDVFRFIDSGKTLQLVGLPKGRVNIVGLEYLAFLQLSPWQGAFEKALTRSGHGKHVIKFALELMSNILYQKYFYMLGEAEKREVSQKFDSLKDLLEFGAASLMIAAEPTIYSYGVTTSEIGFLRASEAAKGDHLVFVPGCFHHLILRRRENTTENFIRWTLVGLAAMIPTRPQGRGYSQSEWANLLKDGAVYRYNIA